MKRAEKWQVVVVAAALIAGLGMSRTEVAGQQWSWPERSENLQNLPADFPAQRLSAVMRGFTNALGVRCSHCHVGEEGQPLSAYDFASDDNPNKVTARAMLDLLGSVNDHLGELEPSGEEVNMWCHTCHNGKARPQTLAEAITERSRMESGQAAVAYFLELRDRFYGGNQYDFRPNAVAQLGSTFFEAGDTTTASRFLHLNTEHYPESSAAWEALGDLRSAESDPDGARTAWERALELSPENPRIQAKLAGGN